MAVARSCNYHAQAIYHIRHLDGFCNHTYV